MPQESVSVGSAAGAAPAKSAAKPMTSVRVTFELVTPAFAGAAYTQHTDGLRIPEIKGLIRFWWRSMGQGVPTDALRGREADIFGSADGTVGHKFRIRPEAAWKRPGSDKPGTAEPNYGYIAYGPVSRPKKKSPADPTPPQQLMTPRLHAAQAIQLVISFPSCHRDEVLGALWLLSAFGGYGSRSRRGWGSLRLKGEVLAEWTKIKLMDPHDAADAGDLEKRLVSGLRILVPKPASATARPPHSAFGPDSRLVIGTIQEKWKDALGEAERPFAQYRRLLGKNIHTGVGGPDYRIRQGWIATGPAASAAGPVGSVFGLPHNARFRNTGTRVEVGVETGGGKLDGRRASPVFIKVLSTQSGAVALFLWLPAQFLGSGLAVSVKAAGRPLVKLAAPGDAAIQQFLFGGTSVPAVTWPGLTGGGFHEVKW